MQIHQKQQKAFFDEFNSRYAIPILTKTILTSSLQKEEKEQLAHAMQYMSIMFSRINKEQPLVRDHKNFLEFLMVLTTYLQHNVLLAEKPRLPEMPLDDEQVQKFLKHYS